MRYTGKFLLLMGLLFASLLLPAQTGSDSISIVPIQPPSIVEIPVVPLPPIDITENIYLRVERGLVPQEVRRLYRLRTLDQILEQSPEIYVRNYGVTGIAMPSLRGTGAGHTQVFWKGIPVNSSTLGVTDLSLSPVELFSHIQVIPGLESMKWGTGGLGGAIGLGERENEGRILRKSMGAAVEGGSFRNLRGSVNFAAPIGESGLNRTGVYFSSGRNDFPFRNATLPGSPEQRMVHAERRQFAFSEDLVLPLYSSSDHLSIHLFSQFSDRNLPPSLLTTNLTETQRDFQQRSMLRYTRKFYLRRTWRVTGSAAHILDDLHYQNELAQIDSRTRTQQYVGDVELNDWEGHRRSENHFGLRWGRQLVDSEGIGGPLGIWNGTAYMSRKGRITRNHGLELLIRESFQDSEWTAPMGYLKWTWNNPDRAVFSNINTYLSLGRNERFPSLNDLYWQPGGNPNLQAESSWTVEAGAQTWRRNTRQVDRRTYYYRLGGEAHVYASQIDNYILWTPGTGSFWTAENVQQVRSYGGEGKVELDKSHPWGHWRIQAGYALSISQNQQQLNPNDQSIGKQLIYTPLHNGTARASLQVKRFGFQYGQQITGRRFTTRDNSESLPAFTTGRVRLDVKLLKRTHQHLQAWASVENIWNAAYEHLPFRPMPGRQFSLGITYQPN